MNRLLWMPLALLLAACSGTDSVALDAPQQPQQPAQQDVADAGAHADVTVLPGLDAAVADEPAAHDAQGDDAATCSGYAGPTTSSVCHACTSGNCQPNGCFGGYYCDLVTEHCVAKPDGC